MNDKTSLPGLVCQCAEPCLIYCGNSTTTTPKVQPPRMGSAMRAFLRRYADDLRPFAEATGDRVAIAMLECCDLLLIEADRIEGVRP